MVSSLDAVILFPTWGLAWLPSWHLPKLLLVHTWYIKSRRAAILSKHARIGHQNDQCNAALRAMVQSGGKGHVQDVVKQLMLRLKTANDWLVSLARPTLYDILLCKKI